MGNSFHDLSPLLVINGKLPGFRNNFAGAGPKFLFEFNHLRFLFSFTPPKNFFKNTKIPSQVPYQQLGKKKSLKSGLIF